jgi:hypothetical protein
MGAERAGSGSPFTPVSYSDDREASDSDKDLVEKKRKRLPGKTFFELALVSLYTALVLI